MKAHKLDELLYGSVTVLALFIVQVIVGKAGGFVADSISYRQFDPHNAYLKLSSPHQIDSFYSML